MHCAAVRPILCAVWHVRLKLTRRLRSRKGPHRYARHLRHLPAVLERVLAGENTDRNPGVGSWAIRAASLAAEPIAPKNLKNLCLKEAF